MKKTVVTCRLVNYFLFAGLIVNLFIMIYFKLSINNHINSTLVTHDEIDPARTELISLYDRNQEETEGLTESLQMAHTYFYAADLQVISDRTVPVMIKSISNEVQAMEEWYLGNIPLHTDPMVVDFIAETVGGSITIYQKSDMGFICISSTLNNVNGGRCVGRVLPFTSAVGRAVSEGVTFTEIVKVGDKSVHTAYEPIIHNGVLIGILSVSISTENDNKSEGRLG